ncbi:MAG TPA: class I SAM-dependent methyltransferase [Candidatus Limnocylindrales bacterium]
MTAEARESEHETEAQALARLYDLDLELNDPGDVGLYVALAARTGGPVLELGVGTGRVAVPLAAGGLDVVGVDRDQAMLARARARAEAAGLARPGRLELVEGDMTSVRLADAGRFQLVIVALNTLTLLDDRASQRAVLQTVADHLAPGGLAVVDVWLPDGDDLARFDGRLALESRIRDPTTGRITVKTAAAVHESVTGTVELTQIWEEGMPGEAPIRWTRSDRLRLLGAGELADLAGGVGLEVETLAGDYSLEPLGSGAERVVLLARRPG